MVDLREIPALRAWRAAERAAGRRVAFVPTMGALHAGHLALVDLAARLAPTVLMSVFVNPLQFGPGEDFARYPRDLDRDRALAAGRGVAALFVPAVEAMYPPGAETRVVPGPMAERWEGAQRPGHFAGVLTVVAKLLNLVQPDLAVFGQKDIQQVCLVQRMVRDLDLPVEIHVGRTVRETDGLALSSRNAYLSSADRAAALSLSRALRAADLAWRGGEAEALRLHSLMMEQFHMSIGVTVDYIAIVDPDTLRPVERADGGTIVAVAARVGRTRLLDNHILGTEFC
ncbi:MAG: pantoate--beta-alanine ligase [Gemmatimonadetes bacterium]|nr:pantoate--beta-alanine ligase [Gemmatimonadota bacterium]MBK7348549.1 pantoate--beta-alanine ligase [Gemmatimonadota bacterium]MBK7783177.1 pantoate--beta-alanine ligase [Gemmatimonadota bacterium]MBK7924119.1 pantoate--beta-alanine ligase [Gemmatimonadota bacterium]MBK9068774.1 pantoate--beta-alanine ligase [Gemmatimonadota bacterium]